MSDIKIAVSRKDELRWIEIQNEQQANKEMLKIAMNLFHNTQVILKEAESEMWKHMFEAYDLDGLSDPSLRHDKESRRYIITEQS